MRNYLEFKSSEALAEKDAAFLWKAARSISRLAKAAQQGRRRLYRQKGKFLSQLYRLKRLRVSLAEITPQRTLLLFVSSDISVSGLHIDFDQLDLDVRRAIAPTVAMLVLGKDSEVLLSRSAAA